MIHTQMSRQLRVRKEALQRPVARLGFKLQQVRCCSTKAPSLNLLRLCCEGRRHHDEEAEVRRPQQARRRPRTCE